MTDLQKFVDDLKSMEIVYHLDEDFEPGLIWMESVHTEFKFILKFDKISEEFLGGSYKEYPCQEYPAYIKTEFLGVVEKD